MVNRFTLGLAAALFLALPLHAAGEGLGVVGHDTAVQAELTNVEGLPLADAERRARAMEAAADTPATSSRVVEGHTTYAVVDVVRPPDSGFQVVGSVACRYVVLGLAVETPGLVHPDGAACRPGGTVYFTIAGTPPPMDLADMNATGWERVVHAPDTGRPVLVKEYAYPAPDGSGGTGYAWETELLREGVNPHTGNAYNFVGAVNTDRLNGSGANHLDVWTMDAFP